MRTSEAVNEIATAMAKAQGALKPASKDAENPHFRSKYADMASVWEAVRGAFPPNGLSIWQDVTNGEAGIAVSTRVVHSSGQWVEFGPLVVPLGKQDAHGVGSATSYAKRYALAAAVGVVAELDDDGNAAVEKPSFSIQERDKYVSRFNDAFDMDAEEIDIAKAVKSIHGEISHKHDLYIAVGEALGTRRGAIRKYIDMLKKVAA